MCKLAGMKKLMTLFVLLSFGFSPYSQTKSYKRGVAYGYHSASDMQKASANISWWYNWATQPDAAIRSNYQNYNVDFTPMAWNNLAIGGVKSWTDRDTTVKYILGFNEPNFNDQAKMTPSQAAKAWPSLQKIAYDNNLKIVGPAVNYCGNCVSEGDITYSNPFKYLDDFFALCDTCQVDFIGLHWYGSGNSIVNYVNTARKYKKPIWVTEYASWDNSNPVSNVEEQKKYLAGTTNFLERDPDIYRYSWFEGRLKEDKSNPFPYIDLYGASGMLTDLGQLYMDIPVYDPEKKFNIPGRIECEEYYLMSGIFCEPTSDVDGFLNVGWTEYGDWAEYKISTESRGTYNLNARIAGSNSGKIDILVDDILLKTINTPSTGGWQKWTDVISDIELEEGDHILKWRVRAGSFNINWIEISNPTAVNNFKLIESEVYPNPVSNGILNVEIHSDVSGGEYFCQLFDVQGNQVLSKTVRPYRSLFQINLNENKRLPAGIYYLNISGNKSIANQMIVVQ